MRAFLDESGTHAGSRVVVVAGYVISPEELPSLEQEWINVLSKHSLDELHMKEFVPPNGKYSGWSEKDKRVLIEPLIALIHDRCLVGVGAALEMDESMKTNLELASSKAPNLVDTPYQWCLRYCTILAAQWADETDHPGLIRYTLDQGCAHQGRAQKHFEFAMQDKSIKQKYRLGSIAFEDSKACPAIQCADLLAYEMYKESDRMLSSSARGTRKSFLSLFRGSEKDCLVTINPKLVREQITRGMKVLTATLDYLPSDEKFRVMCYALRRMKPKNRETLFDMLPAMRNVYSACIAKREKGMRLDKVPKHLLPSDEYIIARLDEFGKLPES
jgi:hypothetical protein